MTHYRYEIMMGRNPCRSTTLQEGMINTGYLQLNLAQERCILGTVRHGVKHSFRYMSLLPISRLVHT